MSWIMWLLIWIFLGGLPLLTIFSKLMRKGKTQDGYHHDDDSSIVVVARFVISFIAGLILIICNAPDATMGWILVFWILFWTILEMFGVGIRTSVKVAGTLVFIVLLCYGCIVGIYAGYNNALYFDQYITQVEGFPIQNEIPANLIRLTTEDLAKYIAEQHLSEFGSNIKIVDMQVTMYQGRLVWVALLAVKDTWGLTFAVSGLMIIDANNPDARPQIVKEEFAVADGLDFNPIVGAGGNAKAKGYYDIDTALAYGDVYPALNPDGKWVTAVVTFRPDWQGVRHYAGIYVLDKRGNVIDFYQEEIPGWLVQPYDEDTFLEQGIRDWGSHRRGNRFDLWAGGMLNIPRSEDLIAISEDTRYIYDPDTNQIVAMVMMYPDRTGDSGKLSLAGAFKVSPQGISYYNLRQYNFISGVAASNAVKNKITARVGAEYFTAMELLYPVRVGGETKYVWFVPIYFKAQEGSGQIGLAGLGIVDAQEQNRVVVEYTEGGVTGPNLVRKAEAGFLALYGEKPPEKPTSGRVIEGTLTAKDAPYMKDGNTHQWLTIRTSAGEQIDVLVNAELISDVEMRKIQKAQVGDKIAVEVDENNVILKVL